MAYGLRPIQFTSGGYNSGGFTEYPIVDGETDDMFTGCLMLQEAVVYVTALALTPTGATSVLSTVGVAVGFRYVDPNGTPVWSQYYAGNANNTKAFAFIADDPTQRFLIKSDGATVQADMGLNADVVSSTGTATEIEQGSTTTGNSSIVLDFSSQAVTATLGLRLISIPKDGVNETSSTPNVEVKINPDCHQLIRSTGL